MKISRRILIAGTLGVPATAATAAWLLADPGKRAPSDVSITTADGKRLVTANGMPDHAVGDFPNRHDPVPLRPQRHKLEMPLTPVAAKEPVPIAMWLFGIAVNGVPFDPSGPFWGSDGHSGWQFEVLHPANAVALGIDANRAHTQGRGAYHYHGLPTGLLWALSAATPDRPMHLLGYAADGFPIYGPECPGDPTDVGAGPGACGRAIGSGAASGRTGRRAASTGGSWRTSSMNRGTATWTSATVGPARRPNTPRGPITTS